MKTASYPSQLRCRTFMSTGIYSMICFLLRACKLFEYCTFRAKHQTFSLNSLNHKRPMFDSNYGEIDLNEIFLLMIERNDTRNNILLHISHYAFLYHKLLSR